MMELLLGPFGDLRGSSLEGSGAPWRSLETGAPPGALFAPPRPSQETRGAFFLARKHETPGKSRRYAKLYKINRMAPAQVGGNGRKTFSIVVAVVVVAVDVVV